MSPSFLTLLKPRSWILKKTAFWPGNYKDFLKTDPWISREPQGRKYYQNLLNPMKLTLQQNPKQSERKILSHGFRGPKNTWHVLVSNSVMILKAVSITLLSPPEKSERIPPGTLINIRKWLPVYWDHLKPLSRKAVVWLLLVIEYKSNMNEVVLSLRNDI